MCANRNPWLMIDQRQHSILAPNSQAKGGLAFGVVDMRDSEAAEDKADSGVDAESQEVDEPEDEDQQQHTQQGDDRI